MASIINRATIQNQLVPGLDMVTHQNYTAIDDEAAQVFEMRTSNKRDEELLMTSGFGEAFAKEEGEATKMDGFTELYVTRVNFPTISLGFAITEEAIEDDIYENNSMLRAEGLGRAMAQTKQTRAANFYNLAFSTAQTFGDGSPMISATHQTLRGAGTDFSNLLTGELSETALENAHITISTQKDDRGNFTGAVPEQLIIPSALEFTAKKILQSDLSTTTASAGTADDNITNVNDKNILKSDGIYKRVTIIRRLTDSDAWFIRTSMMHGPMMYSRVALGTKEDYDPVRGINIYVARERYGFTCHSPRAIYGSTGA